MGITLIYYYKNCEKIKSPLRQAYDEQGFCIARKAIDAELAAEPVEHMPFAGCEQFTIADEV